jgi:anti-sigma factor ChrR (cupin superfamily)
MAPNSSRFDIPRLIAEGAWQPFREGIDAIRLHGEIGKAGSAAVLRYRPGAKLPAHSHTGLEYIFTIQGTQEDERGAYQEGGLVANFPGTHHSVSSATGCTVLVIWGGDVAFDTAPV